MGLPAFDPIRRVVELPGGVALEVRGLTRREFLERPVAEDEDNIDVAELEVYMLAKGTDTPIGDARSWYDTAPAAVVGPVVEAIYAASGVTVDEGKGDGGA